MSEQAAWYDTLGNACTKFKLCWEDMTSLFLDMKVIMFVTITVLFPLKYRFFCFNKWHQSCQLVIWIFPFLLPFHWIFLVVIKFDSLYRINHILSTILTLRKHFVCCSSSYHHFLYPLIPYKGYTIPSFHLYLFNIWSP